MSARYFLIVVISLFSYYGSAQEFRGIVSTKVYAEKGEIKNHLPEFQVHEDGSSFLTSKIIGVVDTVHNSYSICGDTVIQLQNYDLGLERAMYAQLGPEFYLANNISGFDNYFFKHEALPSSLEIANRGGWDEPNKKFKRKGYNSQWIAKFDPRYGFISDIDTSLSYGWAGHKKGMLNHLFPLKGLHRKIIENRGDDVWIYEYNYQVIDTMTCENIVDRFEFKVEDDSGVDDFVKSLMMTKDIIPKDEREPLILFDAVDQYNTPVMQKNLSGQITYIDFWASWCKPCIKEMPDLKKLSDHYDAKDVRVISISVDTNKQVLSWRKAMDKYKIDWDSWRIDESTTKEFFGEYNMNGVPRYMLLDREGKVMNINAPSPSNPSIIEWLDELIQEF